MHQMNNHFRIGLGLKLITNGFKLVFQFLKVFDDTVMHQRQIVAGHVRVRIRLRRLAVSGPAGVGNAGETLGLCFLNSLFQPGHFALTTDTTDTAIVEQCHTGTVVTPVLKTFEPSDQNVSHITLGNGPDNSAHKCYSLSFLWPLPVSHVALLTAGNRKAVIIHILGDGAARTHRGVFANGNGGNQ